MPTVIMPNGLRVENVPAGATKRDIIQGLIKAGKVEPNEAAEWISGTPESPKNYRAEMENEMSALDKLLVGLGRGAVDVAEGAAQIGLQVGESLGLADDGAADRFTKEAQQERELYDRGNLGAAGAAGRIAGNIAATAVPAGGIAKATGLGKLAAKLMEGGKLAKGAVFSTAGAAGGASQFVEEGDTRAENTAEGAAAGLVLGPAAEKLGAALQNAGRKVFSGATRGKRLQRARQHLRGQVPDDALDAIANDVADGLTPEQAIKKANLERFGLTATRGRISGDMDDLRFEMQQERASGRLSDIESGNRAAALDSAGRQARELAENSETNAYSAGEAAKQALQSARNSAKAAEGAAFDQAGERLARISEDVRISPQNLGRVVGDEIDFLSTDSLRPVAARLRRIGILDANDELIDGAKLTPRQAEAARRVIGNIFQGNDANAKRVAARLQEALKDDVVRDVGEDVFTQARQISAKRFANFDNRAKVDALIKGNVPPERVARNMWQKSFSVGDVKEFLETLSNASPDAAKQMRGAVLEDVFSVLKSGSSDINGVPFISPAQLEKRLSEIGDAKLNAIFGSEKVGEIRAFASTLREALGDRRAMNSSGTSADMFDRLRQGVSAMVEMVPGGRFLTGLARAASEGAQSKSAERMVRRAINLEILKRENLLNQFSDVAGVAAATAGAVAARQDGEEALTALVAPTHQ